jgi:hypothetical protein
MVLALLEGRKTQTRRLCKARNGLTLSELVENGEEIKSGNFVEYRATREQLAPPPHAVGDRLYVRETCRAFAKGLVRGVHYAAGDRWIEADTRLPVESWEALRLYAGGSGSLFEGKFVPSIHMPRWASRLWLEVTDMRVQRLQEISEADAIAEGIHEVRSRAGDGMRHFGTIDADAVWPTPSRAYRALWDSLHTKPGEGWRDNPWIYAASFIVNKGNIDG